MLKFVQMIADTAEEMSSIGFDGSTIKEQSHSHRITLNSTFCGDELNEIPKSIAYIESKYSDSKISETTYLIDKGICRIEVDFDLKNESASFEVLADISFGAELDTTDSKKRGIALAKVFDDFIQEISKR